MKSLNAAAAENLTSESSESSDADDEDEELSSTQTSKASASKKRGHLHAPSGSLLAKFLSVLLVCAYRSG